MTDSDSSAAPLAEPTAKAKHRSTPIAASLTHVPNYPKKLTIYQMEASPFWWVRYYADGKIVRQSTKTTNKKHAIEAAKVFYDKINYRKQQGLVLSAKQQNTSFEHVADAAMEMQSARVKRGELTKMVHENDEWRLRKHVIPFFAKYEVGQIDFFALEQFLRKVAEDKLSQSTLIAYMGIVKKVLTYAIKKELIKALPLFPKIKKVDSARGYFKTREYYRLWKAAQRLIGAQYEIRAVANKKDDEADAHHIIYPKGELKNGEEKQGKPIRNITITYDLRELIVFMTNSFIRPTDIKVLQHKHVEIVERDGRIFLRLSLPPTKKHDKPIVTMKWAVVVYERLRDHYKALDLVKPDDYVFLPQQKNRNDALKDLQRQFNVVLNDVGLKEAPTGESRTLYSLRHTCIMYRFMFGEGIDTVTIARNARTSPEMIDRFYVKQLEGEMNIAAIQSKRRKKKLLHAATNESTAQAANDSDDVAQSELSKLIRAILAETKALDSASPPTTRQLDQSDS